MKFFTNKSIWSKIILVLIFILLFQFAVAKPVQAEDSATVLDGIGGKLIQPVITLVVTIGDALYGLIQSSIMGMSNSLIPMDLATNWFELFVAGLFTLAVLAVAVVCVIAAIPSGGMTLAAFGTIVGIVSKAAIIGSIGIFSITSVMTEDVKENDIEVDNVSVAAYTNDLELPETLYLPAYAISPEEIFQGKILLFNVDFFGERTKIYAKGIDKDGNEVTALSTDDEAMSKIDKVSYYYYETTNENEETIEVKTSKQDIAADLSDTISRWYVAIRNIVLVLMMIVLLYIGIRMLLSTLANDKAKYRQMLMDWFMGVLLLFFMHYIMAFGVTIVQQLTNVISSSVDQNIYEVIIPGDENGKMKDALNETDENGNYVVPAEVRVMAVDENGNQLAPNGTEEISNNFSYLIYTTNLMGQLRLQAQLGNWGTESIGYSIAYFILVLMTAFFVLTYLKRVLYMAFLTLIAPIVSLTYPIDKINDGSAQGFNKWFREYVFNLLLQPLHLLLYYVLIASAFQLASTNIIYSLVAIGFMMPAEKLLRSFFGFQKSETAGAFGGVAGAAMVMSGLKSISSIGSKKGGASAKSKALDSGDDGKVRESKVSGGDVDETDTMFNTLNEGDNEKEPPTDEQDQKDNETAATAVGAMAGAAAGTMIASTSNSNQAEQNAENQEDQAGNVRQVNPELTKEQIEELKKQDLEANKPYGLGEIENREKRKIKNQPLKARAKKKSYKLAKGAMKYGTALASGAGRIVLAGTAATIGASAGILQGDPSAALTYLGAGAVAGSTLGRNTMDLKDATQTGINKLDRGYQRYVARNPDFKSAANDKEIREKIKAAQETFLDNGYSKDEIDQLAYNGTLGRYAANNISAKDMVTIENMKKDMEKDKKVLSTEQGIAIAKYNEKYGEDLASGEKRQETRKAIREHFKEKKNVSEAQSKVLEKGTTGYIDKFRKTGKNVKDLGSK